jgi:alpha-D-xyloside xylohydrolase
MTDRGQLGFTSFDFDPVRFPHSDAMLAALQRRGYHVFVFGAPWALGDNAVDAEQFGYYAPRNNILIDFTNPAAVAWWTQRVQALIDRGITGMKLDRGELESTITELVNVPDQATDIFADGRNGRELKNDYARVFAQVHYNAFAERLGGDFLHYLRAGYAGSQQYGIFWGGDTPGTTTFGLGRPTDLGLRSAILSLARVAFMGFPIWGTDTGGYYQFGDREVFARWLELSAFCPLMEVGGGGAHAPWNMPTQPTYDTEMIDIYRTYVTLHHELLPLIYSLALEAHGSGHPIARPLIFDYPNDANTADLWDEFLLGHDLLVAPVWHTGARSRTVYLPQGTWIDYWNPSSRAQGPQTITADAPLGRLPLYVRAGGILPLEVSSAVTGNGTAASAGRLTIDGYPLGTSMFTLRDDDGTSTFTLSDTPCGAASCVTLGISPSRSGYVVRLLLDSVHSVTLDGRPLTRADSLAALDLASTGWFLDVSTVRLWARFSTDRNPTRLVAIR